MLHPQFPSHRGYSPSTDWQGTDEQYPPRCAVPSPTEDRHHTRFLVAGSLRHTRRGNVKGNATECQRLEAEPGTKTSACANMQHKQTHTHTHTHTHTQGDPRSKLKESISGWEIGSNPSGVGGGWHRKVCNHAE